MDHREMNADERTADLESRQTYDHDTAADRADEQRDAFLDDLTDEVMEKFGRDA